MAPFAKTPVRERRPRSVGPRLAAAERTVMPNDGETVDLIPLYAQSEALHHELLVENPMRLFRLASV